MGIICKIQFNDVNVIDIEHLVIYAYIVNKIDCLIDAICLFVMYIFILFSELFAN